MKSILTAIVLISLAALAGAQSGTTGTPPSNESGGFTAASSSLRILSPTIGQQVASTEITVRYEITDRGADAAPSPNYRIQLDGGDAVETLEQSYSFTGVPVGDHTLTIQLVDANHNPIAGSLATVHFKTFAPGANGTTSKPRAGRATPQTTGALAPPTVVKAKLPLPGSAAAELPDAGGELPLLSMVGFGVLLGGVISAMRTRK